jgi:pantetheine-phosphate adenylyltransferase
MKIGIYPGAFDPFHVGHENVYWKAKALFDCIYVVRAINKNKPKPQSKLPSFSVNINHKGLLTDLIERVYHLHRTENIRLADILFIRGFRNLDDIKYNTEQDYWLKRINPNFKSIHIECDEEFKHVSSSTIKQLINLNQETKHLIV